MSHPMHEPPGDPATTASEQRAAATDDSLDDEALPLMIKERLVDALRPHLGDLCSFSFSLTCVLSLGAFLARSAGFSLDETLVFFRALWPTDAGKTNDETEEGRHG